MIIGGIVAGFGIVNPRPEERRKAAELAVASRSPFSGECGRSTSQPCPSPVPGSLGEPVGAGAGSGIDSAL